MDYLSIFINLFYKNPKILFLIAFSNLNFIFAQNWNEIIKLSASDRYAGDQFGHSVAISGDYAIVGAKNKSEYDIGGNKLEYVGSAYIFKNIEGEWKQVQKIVASDRGYDDFFGRSVAISGEYAIVAASHEDHNVTGGATIDRAGSIYIFKNIEGSWTQVQKIVASVRGVENFFGSSLSISGDILLVGALGDANYTGAAYIFKNIDGFWTQIQKIVASDREVNDQLGCSVSISGDYLIVGAYHESIKLSGENYSLFAAGAAYIFKNINGTWTQVQKIVAPKRVSDDYFGSSVAISGDYAIVSANGENYIINAGNPLLVAGSGVVYIYENQAGIWTFIQKITASDREAYSSFGRALDILGDYAIIGAHRNDKDAKGGNTLKDAGSAYIFKNIAGTWTQVEKIVASDRGNEDFFGQSVAISGVHLIVGAIYDDHDATGGNTLNNAGSAYIFKNNSAMSGIVENSFGNGLIVYPNPNNGNFSIELGAIHENIQIQIIDIFGRLIESNTIAQSKVLNLSIFEPSGIYFISIIADNKKAVIRLVKE